MPINDRYMDDADYGWASHNPGIIGGFCLVMGIAVGVAVSQFWLQQDLREQLAAVERDVKATHHPLNQLTGFKDASNRTNSLLGRLETQSGMLYKAGQTIQQTERLNEEIARLAAKLDSIEAAAEKMAKMESNLTYANAKLAVAEGRVRQLEELANRLKNSGPQVYMAQDALASIELIQQQLINQQCVMPELTETVNSQWKLQDAICDLAAQADATDRAIDSLATNQDRVQQLAIDTESSQSVLNNVQYLLKDQQSMDLQVKKLADTLDAATELSYEAIRLNTQLCLQADVFSLEEYGRNGLVGRLHQFAGNQDCHRPEEPEEDRRHPTASRSSRRVCSWLGGKCRPGHRTQQDHGCRPGKFGRPAGSIG